MIEPTQNENRGLGDSFAVAILQWPAAVGAVMLDGPGWELALRIVLGIWVVLVSLGMIVGRTAGPRWGLMLTICGAGDCISHRGAFPDAGARECGGGGVAQRHDRRVLALWHVWRHLPIKPIIHIM